MPVLKITNKSESDNVIKTHGYCLVFSREFGVIRQNWKKQAAKSTTYL
jgi:hypothetical protein